MVIVLGLGIFSAAGANDPVPAGASAYAQGALPAVIEGMLSSQEEAENYGFTHPVEGISIDVLRNTYRPSDSLLAGLPVGSWTGKITKREEWIAVVRQGGAPRNVVGVWEASTGVFEMSTFGYGSALAAALDKIAPSAYLMFEAPVDAWYEVNATTVRPLSGDLSAVESKEMTWLAYERDLQRRMTLALNDDTMDSTADVYGPTSGSGRWMLVVAGGAVVAIVLAGAALLWIQRARGRLLMRAK
jgi:hypothetical protein